MLFCEPVVHDSSDDAPALIADLGIQVDNVWLPQIKALFDV